VPNGLQTFLGLLDAVVDRTADILERTAAEVEVQSRAIFGRPRGAAFEQILNRLGRAQNVNSKARDSLVSLARLLSFAALAEQFDGSKDLRDHLKSLQRDVQSITDHSSYLAGNITFLLDAALGLINIEQNSIFKVFSVFSVVLMPPTLIAGIYGMNFEHMPELRWAEGYPMAILLMALAAAAPFLWFRRKGWL
jgi:magnesium transporter